MCVTFDEKLQIKYTFPIHAAQNKEREGRDCAASDITKWSD